MQTGKCAFVWNKIEIPSPQNIYIYIYLFIMFMHSGQVCAQFLCLYTQVYVCVHLFYTLKTGCFHVSVVEAPTYKPFFVIASCLF